MNGVLRRELVMQRACQEDETESAKAPRQELVCIVESKLPKCLKMKDEESLRDKAGKDRQEPEILSR